MRRVKFLVVSKVKGLAPWRRQKSRCGRTRACATHSFQTSTYREEQRFVMRIVISAVVVVALLLALAVPALAQGQQSCDWYWGYKFNPAGAYEYWCWDPQLGWWYSTDGKNKSMDITM